MSKKRSKSAQGSAGVQRWEQALLSGALDEEKWSATIAFVVGNQLEDYSHINVLASAVNSGTRKLFNIVTKDELYAQVTDLGNPKSKKPKEVPQNYEVCEPCKEYLDSGENIPVALLAKLLKFKFLDVKQKDLKRREAEKKAAQEKDKPGKKGDKKERGKSPSKGKGKKTPEPPSAKEGSKLRKRGEEDTDSKYIDDEPDDGTDNYIFVSGFHEPHLIGQLAEIGINVDCIIKVTSEDYSRFETKLSPFDELDQPPEQDEKQLAAAEEERKRKAKKVKELKQFWKDILLLLQGAPAGSKLHDVARLEYVVKEAIIPESLEENELMTKFGVDLFEDTACMVYDLLDAKRHWKNFLENLKLIQVSDFGQATSVPPGQETQSVPSITPAPTIAKTEKGPATESVVATEVETKVVTEVDTRYYNELMNSIPHESVSVPLVMHCMLEQVVASEEDREPPSETPRPPRADGLETSLAKHINTAAYKLALSEEEKEALANDFEPPVSPEPVRKQPLLLTHRDKASMRLNHLKPVNGFDPMKAELEMMGYYPVADLQEFPVSTPREVKERATRLQELLHFCATGGTTASEIDHAFKQFVFESVKLATTDADGNVQTQPDTPQVDIPWDDPYPYFKGMIPTVVQEEGEEDEDRHVDIRSGAKSPSPCHPDNTVQHDSPAASGGTPEKTESRPGSGSILRGATGASSRKSTSAHSVHFERDDDGNLIEQPGDNGEVDLRPPSVQEDVPLEDLMNTVNDTQKRNLDQWCFAEHLEPHVLLQVLKDSLYTHPYVDTYYHGRDNTLMVVLHNPYAENLQRTVNWHCALYSNVGFRNYLEYIADSVSEWTREQEAKYQASLLAVEVEKIHKDADEASSRPTSAKDKKRERSKSPKKSPGRGKSPSRASSTERPSSANPYVRSGSLKAWREEQDRIKAEEEAKEREKAEKRARSAQKKASKEAMEAEKKEKRPASRSSSKSKASKEEIVPPPEQPEEPAAPERYWPFTGYDMGNHLLHAKGTVSSMFPADGAQICTEKYEFIQGTVGVKSTVHKDGHTFMVHVLDPKGEEEEEIEETTVASVPTAREDGQEKADTEKSEKLDQTTARTEGTNTEIPDNTSVGPAAEQEPAPTKPCVGKFGCFCAQLNDGMSLSLSTYGLTGESANGQVYQPKPYVAPPPRSPSPAAKDAGSPTKGKRDKNKTGATPEPPPQEEEPKKEEVKTDVKVTDDSFQQLCVTCPDGLSVNYFLESAAGITSMDPTSKRLLVRQSYPFPTQGVQPCESRRQAAMEETSRVLSSDGTVVKVMKNGSTQVLYSDGGVSQFCLSTPLIPASRTGSPQRAGSAKSDRATTPTKKKERQSRSSAKKKEVQEAPVEEVVIEPGYWVTTTATGERVATAMDGAKVPVKDALVCKATDPQTRQVMYTREDHTIIVHHPDSTTVVEHADGTRITTFYTELKLPADEAACDETGETTVPESKIIRLVQIECPGFATVRFDTETSECSTEFGTGTILNTFIDGSYDLYHFDGGYLRVDEDGTTIYHAQPNNDLEVLDPNRQLNYVMRHFADVIVEMVDNQGNVFSVQNTGETTVMMNNGDEIVAEEVNQGQGQDGNEPQEAENMDQPAPEIHTETITRYKQHTPKFFIINQDGSGTELLRYQDVSRFIADAEDDLTTAILMDPLPDHPGVMGITILKPYLKDISEQWIKGYTQKSIMPPGLNSRDLTTLPAKEMKTDGPAFGTTVGQGLAVGSVVHTPLLAPILKCPSALEIRQLLQFKPITDDIRTRLSAGLQEYAEYVKARLAESEALQVQDPRSEDERILAADLQCHMSQDQAIRTASPAPLSEDVKELYQTVTAPPVPSPPPTPQPKRTQADWDRDARERAQEEECRQALQDHDVPPYFESQLGKAFLLTQAPDVEALTQQLSEDPRRDETKAVRSGSNTPQSSENTIHLSSSVPPPETTLHASHIDDRSISMISPPEHRPAVAPVVESPPPQLAAPTGNTPSALRPGNPTPSHATGQGSPTSVRPHNPTPATANKLVPDRPENPAETPSFYPSIPENEQAETTPDQDPLIVTPDEDPLPETPEQTMKKSRLNVLGEPRLAPIQIPGYIRSGRPGALPNERFLRTEDPVRRKIYTTSITGATPLGAQILSNMRGFELLPDRVDFGTLREGSLYNFTLLLKNSGVDTCRFKIKQPPPSTGMKVLFKPGPVAAGMKTELCVEIYAIAVGVEGERGVGRIDHNLEITTETDHLTVPITATVLTAIDYDNREKHSPRDRKAPGVRHISDRCPGGQGIIRPRKDNTAAVH